MNNTSNKDIVSKFYKQVIGLRDDSLIPKLVRHDYIQHSPSAKDGREGLMKMVAFLKQLPPASPDAKSPVKMLIADGDFVAGLMDINFMGKRMLVIDLFRLQDGLLAEHWDAVQQVDGDFMLDEIKADVSVETSIGKSLIAETPEADFRRVMGEGDIVVTQAEIVDGDKQYASYTIFRVVNSLPVKLLNICQQIPAVMMHGNGMV